MRCSYYEILISTYADGELSELDLAKVMDHIECCDNCRQIYEETKTLQRDITTALMDLDETPDLVSAVISKTRSSRVNISGWLWAAAAVFTLIAICAHLLLPSERNITHPKNRLIAKTQPVRQKHEAIKPTLAVKLVKHKSANHIQRKIANNSLPKSLPKQKFCIKSLIDNGSNATADDSDKVDVVVEYLDSDPVAQRSEDMSVLSAPSFPVAGKGKQLIAETETITVNGKGIQGVCAYRIINKTQDITLNSSNQGEQDGAN